MVQIADFISKLLSVYSLLIWVRIFMSWFIPYSRPGSVSFYLSAIVDPYLNLFRSRRMRLGFLDFSPLVAIGLLAVVQAVFSTYAQLGVMSLAIICYLFISAIWSYAVSIFLILAIILLVMKMIACFTNSSFSYGINSMPSFLDPIEKKINRIFFPHSIPKRWVSTLIMLVIMIILYFGLRYAFAFLATAALSIPI